MNAPAPRFQPKDPSYAERVHAEVHDAQGTHVASMQQTLMMLPDTPDTAE